MWRKHTPPLTGDATNGYRRAGASAEDAIVQGATRRFRPILLTSLTTFFGLAPMIAETSVQARFLIPMALSLGFGVLFATVLILLVVPALYLILEDILSLLPLSEGRHGISELAQGSNGAVQTVPRNPDAGPRPAGWAPHGSSPADAGEPPEPDTSDDAGVR